MTNSTIPTTSQSREACNECGKSVAFGSGWYVNRVPDGNPFDERVEMGKPFPHGEFICAECEEGFNQLSEQHS
ncbi:MAG: hypothetical protein MUF71_06445 [Candidatus Kapabacteria bacterium]|jgi:hypothetical protein|nr:hypothetical protein [Candidatus Kapabacteria bacterium]